MPTPVEVPGFPFPLERSSDEVRWTVEHESAAVSATAAPQSVRHPAMRPVDDQGLLDSVASSVATRSSQLISTVRELDMTAVRAQFPGR